MRKREKARVLRKAAELVLERGLAKGDFGEPDGPCCLIGAVCYAEGGAPANSYVHELTPVAYEFYASSGWALIDWNDDPETTADDVASALLSEAEGLR